MFHGQMRYGVTSLLLLTTLGSVQASLLNIRNAGFEELGLNNGEFTNSMLAGRPMEIYQPDLDQVIPGWTIMSAGPGTEVGTWDPQGFHFVGIPYEGENVAFSNDGGVIIAQTLTDTLAANVTYTLMVDVGKRTEHTYPGYRVQLLAGGAVLVEDNNTMDPGWGNVKTTQLFYTAFAGDPMLGQPLEIRLQSLGPQANFDNVRLDAGAVSAIPEPSSIAMLVLVSATMLRKNRS